MFVMKEKYVFNLKIFSLFSWKKFESNNNKQSLKLQTHFFPQPQKIQNDFCCLFVIENQRSKSCD